MAYRALIVDDSRSARMLLGRMLEGFGLSTHAVESAEQALSWLQQSRPDVIFMDHLMPGMDGFAAVRVIKSDPQTASIPVLMYTSQEGEMYLSQARALGALGVLPKTLKSTDVAEVLKKLNMLAPPQATATPATTPAGQVARPPLPEVTLEEPRESTGTSTAQLAHRIAMELSAELPALKADLDAAMRFWRALAVAMFLSLAAGMAVLAYWQYRTHQAVQSLQGVPAAVATTSVMQAQSSAAVAPAVVNAAPDMSTLVATESVNYGEVPLAGARLERLRNLVADQRNKSAPSVVKLTTFSADFCLTPGTSGAGYELAPEEWPVTRCELIGNPFGDALDVQQRESATFASFVNSTNNGQGHVVVQIQDGGRGALVAYPDKSDSITAGRWNDVARRNQRVEFATLTAQ